MDYWSQEPPTHVLLALRYLGPRKRQVTEKIAREQMAEASASGMFGPVQPVSEKTRDLVNYAEEMLKKMRLTKEGGD